MDISSDSEDTIIVPLNKDFDEPSDTEIENILKKYASTSNSQESTSPTKEVKLDDFDSSDEEFVHSPLIKRGRKNTEPEGANSGKKRLCLDTEDVLKDLQAKYSSSGFSQSNVRSNSDLVILSDDSDVEITSKESRLTVDKQSEDEEDEQLQKLSPKSKAKAIKKRQMEMKKIEKAKEKEKKKQEGEIKKALKYLEKEKKKETVEQQKALKTAIKNVERSVKPDECIKNIIVDIGDEISDKEYGAVLKAVLQNNNISFKGKSQVIPNLISWRRKQQTIENMLVKDTEVSEKHFLLIMSLDEFTNIARNSLTHHIRQTIELINSEQLSLAVFGTDKVKGELEYAVTEAQLHTKCYFRYVKRSEDLAAFVLEVTKAVAQIPYKLKKEEKHMLQSEYFNDFNKDSVRIDKNGNGLSRLWQQILTMFPLARLETAEAITAVYPNPSSLFKAYEDCAMQKEKLIQDLTIRRAFGPCTSARRIGPELSRKCYNFFCSTENVLL